MGPRFTFIMIVVAVCGAVWLSDVSDTLRNRSLAIRAAEQQHDNIAAALAEQAARTLQAADLIVQQAALLDPAGSARAVDVAQIPELLRRHMSGVPQVHNLFMFDPARHLHLSSTPLGAAYLEVSDRSYFTVQRDDPNAGLYVSEPFVSRTTGIPTFVLSRRLPGPGFRGVVGAAVDVAYFGRFYHALELGAGSSVDLLRTDGVTLVTRDRDDIGTAPVPWFTALNKPAPETASHTIVRRPDLGETRVSVRRVPGFPAVVAVSRSEDAILSAWRIEAWRNASRTFAVTVLAAILLVAFLRELNRQERATAQLHQSQKLEALGTLAGGIAHDFNNILGAVLGYGELAQQHTAPESNARRYVDNIVIAATRARDLVARILTFSRPIIGERSPVALQELVSEVCTMIAAARPAEVQLELRLAPEPLVVMGDGAQLHQMVGNLVTNAVQAVGGGGTVVVTVDSARISAPQDFAVGSLASGRYARLQIADPGVGMSAEQVQRIFDPFFTTKPVGEGTGLGLSLVHGIVLDHGGAVAVASEPGVGTTFSVYLPVSDMTPDTMPAPTTAPRGAGQIILVVDDEEMLVRLAEEVLAELGYEPVGCVGAKRALEAFRAAPGRFDALLTDVVMPELSGPELATELRRLRPELPVVMMSGFGGPDLQVRADAAGARAVLMKPLRAAELARCLADVLRPADDAMPLSPGNRA